MGAGPVGGRGQVVAVVETAAQRGRASVGGGGGLLVVEVLSSAGGSLLQAASLSQVVFVVAVAVALGVVFVGVEGIDGIGRGCKLRQGHPALLAWLPGRLMGLQEHDHQRWDGLRGDVWQWAGCRHGGAWGGRISRSACSMEYGIWRQAEVANAGGLQANARHRPMHAVTSARQPSQAGQATVRRARSAILVGQRALWQAMAAPAHDGLRLGRAAPDSRRAVELLPLAVA